MVKLDADAIAKRARDIFGDQVERYEPTRRLASLGYIDLVPTPAWAAIQALVEAINKQDSEGD